MRAKLPGHTKLPRDHPGHHTIILIDRSIPANKTMQNIQNTCTTVWVHNRCAQLDLKRIYFQIVYRWSCFTVLTLRLMLSLRSSGQCQSVDDNLYYRLSVLPRLQYRSYYTTYSLCSFSVTSNDFFHICCHISLLLSTPWRRHYIYITPPFWLWINLCDIHFVYTRVGNSLHFLRNVSF